jgi:hypothetical protein
VNRTPLRPITDEDAEIYARDGAVCLRRVFDRDWIDALLPPARSYLIENQDIGLLPHRPGTYMARLIPAYRELAFNSPLGEVCGRVMRSREVRFFYDQFFAKPPRSTAKTVWHNDRGGWPVTGTMVPSFWMPLTPIVKQNSLEVLAGTHRRDVLYWNITANSRQIIKPADRPNVPDAEAVRGNPDYRFLAWDMEPGDVLLIHPWALHYSSGNPIDSWRIAISIRVFGDDVRWAPRPECVNVAGVSFDEMIPGERPAGHLFPLIWSDDGRREPTDDYPRGFATTWSSTAADRLARGPRAPSYEEAVLERGGYSRLEPAPMVQAEPVG